MIDIVIPTYEGKHHLERCLTSIDRNTLMDRDEWRVVIADDHSPSPEMQDYLVSQPWPVISNTRSRGFPGNCNCAVSKLDGEFIVLLNSDTEVGTGWLRTMAANMEDRKVGIVGVRLLYPTDRRDVAGRIQHAGVARDSIGRPYHIWRGEIANYGPAMTKRKVNAVTFACVMIRRSCWEDLGGLDEGYVMGQFEDVDACWTARKKGWEIVYEPAVWIYHYEHGAGEEIALKSAEPNRQRLMDRWANIGSDEWLFSPVSLFNLDESQVKGLLGSFVHQVRGAAMCYAWQRESHDHRDHCRRLAAMEYGGLPQVEKDWANQWMERLLILLKGVPQ